MDHNVSGGLTILLPCDIQLRVVLLRTLKRTDESRFFTSSEESHDVSGVSGPTEYSQFPALLQPRAGQEPARAQGLRLPRDRRHSLQRCPDLITSDTDSSETRAKFSSRFNPQRGPGCLLGKANGSVAVSAFHVD